MKKEGVSPVMIPPLDPNTWQVTSSSFTIEQPRVRSVLFAGEYKRLAFPYVVRWDRWLLRLRRGAPRIAQYVWVTPDAPTWDSPLCYFPLTWWVDPYSSNRFIETGSHYGSYGGVCYGFQPPGKSHAIAGSMLWNSNHFKYHSQEVLAWEELTKEHGGEATRALEYLPVTQPQTSTVLTLARIVADHFPGETVPVPLPVPGIVELGREPT